LKIGLRLFQGRRLIHSLARRACILNASSEHGAVQLRLAVKRECSQGDQVNMLRDMFSHAMVMLLWMKFVFIQMGTFGSA
jgi:hypothetical protein